jgi:hypothetical protein
MQETSAIAKKVCKIYRISIFRGTYLYKKKGLKRMRKRALYACGRLSRKMQQRERQETRDEERIEERKKERKGNDLSHTWSWKICFSKWMDGKKKDREVV